MTGAGAWRRAGVPGGWALIVASAVELVAREVARRAPVEMIGGWRPGLPALVLTAAAGGALVLASRPAAGRRAWHRTAPALFAVLFTTGVAYQL